MTDTNVIRYEQFERVCDNTVPQAAWAYFENPRDRFLEIGSEGYFVDFVTTYINAPQIRTPIPNENKGDDKIREPFITLWQKSGDIERHASVSNDTFRPLGLLNDFVHSVKERPEKWSRWIAFQWTPEITPAFKIRRNNWQAEIRKAHTLLCDGQNQRDNRAWTKLKELLKGDLGSLENHKYIDPEYENEYISNKISREDYGIAYAFDWFLRGDSYANRFCNSMLKFHNLRNNISYREQRMHEMPFEIHWGLALNRFVKQGVFKRDESFCDILRRLRTSVQALKVHDQLIEYNRLCGPEFESSLEAKRRKDKLWKDIVIGSFSDSGVVPFFKNQQGLINNINKIGEELDMLGVGRLLARTAVLVLRVSIVSRTARSWIMGASRSISPDFCFKIFDTPEIQRKVL